MVPGYASQFYCSQECQQSWQGQAIGAIQLETITVYFSDQETLF